MEGRAAPGGGAPREPRALCGWVGVRGEGGRLGAGHPGREGARR
jgi:hypothetical protein